MMSGVICHGGGLDTAIAQFGGDKKDWLDLSTGINPNGYRVEEMEASIWQRLPDVGAMDDLLEAARNYYGVGENSSIVAASGTQALIEMLPNVLNAKKAAIISPTYSEHANVWRKHRVEIVELDLGEDVPDDVQVLVITNPNNPDARLIEVKQLLAFAEKMKMRKGWLIVDEAFCDSMPDQSLVPYLSDNVIVLRSIGKFFGLAGLRLGFAIASPKIGKILETLMGPWAVSGPALETGRRALLDTDWISQTRDALFLQSKELAQVLTQCGFGIEGVNPLFVYVRHEKAVRVHEALAKRHILVRYFLERPEFLRFGLCANKGQLGRFKMVLDEVMTNV